MRILISIILLIGLGSCTSNNPDGGNRVLARVHNKALLLSDLDGLFPAQTTSEDSTLIISAFTKRWVKDAVMMHAAEKYVVNDFDIEELVEKYRENLVLQNYERILVEERLDTTITQDELNAFYEANKTQFELDKPIIRCLFIKVKRDEPDLDKLSRWWDRKDFAALKSYCSSYATTSYLDDKEWYKVSEISAQMPTGTLTIDNVNSKKDFTQKDDKYQYYFSMLELVNTKETAPLTYISDQATKVILHDRKMKELRVIKQKMYEEALKYGNIDIKF